MTLHFSLHYNCVAVNWHADAVGLYEMSQTVSREISSRLLAETRNVKRQQQKVLFVLKCPVTCTAQRNVQDLHVPSLRRQTDWFCPIPVLLSDPAFHCRLLHWHVLHALS